MTLLATLPTTQTAPVELVRPSVSVLIPVYNNPYTLARAVRSALNQPGVDVQVVICDDASTDDTVEVAKTLCSEWEHTVPISGGLSGWYQSTPNGRIKIYCRQSNGRIAATLNTAAERATGRYLIRLDSDDSFEPGCLARMVTVLDMNPDIGFVYGQRRYYGRRSDTYTPAPFNADDFNIHNAAGYCYMFRREVWDSGIRWEPLGTFGGVVIDMEDWQHLLKMIGAGYVGLAMSDTLVLHYTFGYSGTWQELIQHEGEALAEFKRRFPSVRATNL